uniref:Nucleotide-diphospho-sugar transferase domain-containing protein n=1 Tax=Pinguiococcus pyrenoidosus TaxID=172671 RepID=A0A7R9U484_9STRA|mmetsp:Transcript_1427/g.6224  ORF Transcript_1427/g.6224 Transcript_1427/m.6224 type:complete len:1006 (+) Transcript_1427:234-3251(+)
MIAATKALWLWWLVGCSWWANGPTCAAEEAAPELTAEEYADLKEIHRLDIEFHAAHQAAGRNGGQDAAETTTGVEGKREPKMGPAVHFAGGDGSVLQSDQVAADWPAALQDAPADVAPPRVEEKTMQEDPISREVAVIAAEEALPPPPPPPPLLSAATTPEPAENLDVPPPPPPALEEEREVAAPSFQGDEDLEPPPPPPPLPVLTEPEQDEIEAEESEPAPLESVLDGGVSTGAAEVELELELELGLDSPPPPPPPPLLEAADEVTEQPVAKDSAPPPLAVASHPTNSHAEDSAKVTEQKVSEEEDVEPLEEPRHPSDPPEPVPESEKAVMQSAAYTPLAMARTGAESPGMEYLLSRVSPSGNLILLPCEVNNFDFLLNWMFVAQFRLQLSNYAVVCLGEKMQKRLRSYDFECLLISKEDGRGDAMNMFQLTARLLRIGVVNIMWVDPRSVWLRDVQPYLYQYVDADIVAMENDPPDEDDTKDGISLTSGFIVFKNSDRVTKALLSFFETTRFLSRRFPEFEDKILVRMLKAIGLSFAKDSGSLRTGISLEWNTTDIVYGSTSEPALKVAILPQLYFRRTCESWMTTQDMRSAVVVNCAFSSKMFSKLPRTSRRYHVLKFLRRRYLWTLPRLYPSFIRPHPESKAAFEPFTAATKKSEHFLPMRGMNAMYPIGKGSTAAAISSTSASQMTSASSRTAGQVALVQGSAQHETLEERLERFMKRAIAKVIILVSATFEELEALMNFLYILETRFDLVNYGVASRDEALDRWLLQIGVPSYPVYADPHLHNRLLIAQKLVLSGLHVISVVPSVVWLQNPIADLLAADIVTERDRYPPGLAKSWGFTVGTNLIAIQSSPSTRALMKALDLSTNGDSSPRSEKRKFNDALQRLDLTLRSPSGSGVFHDVEQEDDDTGEIALAGDVSVYMVIKRPAVYRKLCKNRDVLQAKGVVVASCQPRGVKKALGLPDLLRDLKLMELPETWRDILSPRVTPQHPYVFLDQDRMGES